MLPLLFTAIVPWLGSCSHLAAQRGRLSCATRIYTCRAAQKTPSNSYRHIYVAAAGEERRRTGDSAGQAAGASTSTQPGIAPPHRRIIQACLRHGAWPAWAGSSSRLGRGRYPYVTPPCLGPAGNERIGSARTLTRLAMNSGMSYQGRYVVRIVVIDGCNIDVGVHPSVGTYVTQAPAPPFYLIRSIPSIDRMVRSTSSGTIYGGELGPQTPHLPYPGSDPFYAMPGSARKII